MGKPSILFLCTGNCCRSQMAEGLMAELAGERLAVHSAGSHPTGFVHPAAITVMAEMGIDLGEQRSKGLDEFAGRTFDYVVTVCDQARGECPSLTGRLGTYHWPLDDSGMRASDAVASTAAARTVRDELKQRMITLLRELSAEPKRVS